MKKVIIGILVLVFFAISTASAEPSEYYLVLEDSSVPEFGNTIEVGLWLNATVPVAGGFVGINYTYCCANIIDYSPNTGFFEDHSGNPLPGRLNVLFGHLGQMGLENQPADSYHLGTLTIQCCDVTSDCTTDLLFVDCKLYESVWSVPTAVPFITTDGTFTCGEPFESECLGTCCNDSNCTELWMENVSCSTCIDADKYWHPNKDTACFDSYEPFDLCIDWCPECCDGDDNDGDGAIDYSADSNCTCGLDLNETTKNPVGPDPILPELPTLALASIGILGAILLARKRE